MYKKIIRSGFVYYIDEDLLKNYDLELMSSRQLSSLSEVVIDEKKDYIIRLTDQELGVT